MDAGLLLQGRIVETNKSKNRWFSNKRSERLLLLPGVLELEELIKKTLDAEVISPTLLISSDPSWADKQVINLANLGHEGSLCSLKNIVAVYLQITDSLNDLLAVCGGRITNERTIDRLIL